MRAATAFVTGLSCVAVSVQAADFCTVLDTWPQATTTVAHPGTGDIAPCKASRMLSGATQTHCAWVFAYRDPAATEAFDQLIQAVAGCLGDTAHKHDDPDVNHPDFYDLQIFDIDGHEVGVSLKDKAALSETYVFLRLTRPE